MKSNFSISIDYLKERITSKTKVIVIINFFGIKQNLKTLYKFCKKNKILLFLDECHTYYNLYHSSDNDCDVKFFSPSKIFDRLNNYGILQVNNHQKKIKKFYNIQKKIQFIHNHKEDKITSKAYIIKLKEEYTKLYCQEYDFEIKYYKMVDKYQELEEVNIEIYLFPFEIHLKKKIQVKII